MLIYGCATSLVQSLKKIGDEIWHLAKSSDGRIPLKFNRASCFYNDVAVSWQPARQVLRFASIEENGLCGHTPSSACAALKLLADSVAAVTSSV